MAVVTVLLVAVVAAIVAFLMAAISTFSLNLAQRNAGYRDAEYLAEAAVAQTIDSIRSDQTFGTHGESVTVQPDAGDSSRSATVTFNTSDTIPYSTNNSAGNNSTGSGSVSVPAGTVRLLGVGTSRGVSRTVEVVLTVPAFPYVLAVDGPLASSSGLTVSTATSMSSLTTPTTAPASMASNSTITVADSCTVSGDVVAAGTITLPPNAIIGGVVCNGTVDIPQIDPTQWNPTGQAGAQPVNPTYSSSLTVTASNYAQGDVSISGDLILSNGLLYVPGNLQVSGGIRGQGAVIVLGTTLVTGGANLSSNNMVALLGNGNITFSGGSQANYFQGLVYTHGVFSATNITVAGTFIASQSSAGGSTGISLTNANAIYVSAAANMNVSIGSAPTLFAYTSPENGTTYYNGVCDFNAAASPPGSDPFVSSALVNAATQGLTSSAIPIGGDDNPTFVLKAPGAPYEFQEVESQNLSNQTIHTVSPDDVFLPPATPPNPPSAYMYLSTSPLQVNDEAIKYDASTNQWSVDPNAPVMFTTYNPVAGGISTIPQAQAETIANSYGTTVEAMIAFSQARQQLVVNALNSSGLLSNSSINLSLNQFLRDTVPYRVVSWKAR